MDTRHLNCFIALAEEGLFTAAARRLNIVQSGLSVTIKEMEDELGVQLVSRTTRKVSLTPAGELFLEHARASLSSLREGIEAVRSQNSVVRGRLQIGVLQSLAPYVDLPAVLARFRQRYPLVEFSVRSVNTGDVPGQVRSGFVDLSFNAVVTHDTFPGLTTIPFAEDELVAICAKSHPLAKLSTVTLPALCSETFVDLSPERALRQLTDQVCAAHGLKRNSVYQVTDVDSLLQFVDAGLGVAIVPSRFCRNPPYSLSLCSIRLTGSRHSLPNWRLVVVTRTQKHPATEKKSAIDLFLETVREVNANATHHR